MRLGRIHSGPAPVDLPMTDGEIGSYLRLAQGAVRSALRDLVEARLINLCERTVWLSNPSDLIALVEEGKRCRGCRTACLDWAPAPAPSRVSSGYRGNPC
jgi:hypothetical protein